MAEEEKPASPAGGEIPKIRTFKTDAEVFMREKNISQLDAARSAYVHGEPSRAQAAQFNFYHKIAVAAGAVLVIALAAYFAFRLFSSPAPSAAPEAPKPAENFLPVENQTVINFSESNPGSLISALLAQRAQNLRYDTVIYLPIQVLTNSSEEKFADAAELIGFLNWQPPQDFLGNLEPNFNMLAVYTGNSRDLAVIFKIKNFPGALASLFSWERSIWSDWKIFLSPDDVKNINQFSFADDIIQNNDARVLKNSQGKIILGYSIFNKQYVIISTSRDALSTILERLIALPPR